MKTEKEKSILQQFDCLENKNNSFFFWLQQITFHFKEMPNSVDFSKGIVLHIILPML